ISIGFASQTEGWLTNGPGEMAFLDAALGNPVLRYVSWENSDCAPLGSPETDALPESDGSPDLVNVWCADQSVLQDVATAGPGMTIDCGIEGAGGAGGEAGASGSGGSAAESGASGDTGMGGVAGAAA